MKDYYYELIIKPDSYYELFLDLVSSLSDDAIEELDGTIIIRSEDELENIKLGIEAFTKELCLAFDTKIACKIFYEKKENKDWVKIYQNSVQPIEIGKFYIHPSWYEPKKDKLNIVIDPTLAFGSGHHETTNRCLNAIQNHVNKDDEVCDVGTGSGILAIAACKLGAKVDICDTDPICIGDSLKNFESNSEKPLSYWEGSANSANKKYDVVIANIVADVLSMISNDLIKITKEDGIIILSGIMEQYKQKVLNKFNKKCEILEELQENEWVTLVVKKLKENNE